MKLSHDDVDGLRECVYALQEATRLMSMERDDPRMATLSAVTSNVTNLLDDRRGDLLDEIDEAAWVKEHSE